MVRLFARQVNARRETAALRNTHGLMVRRREAPSRSAVSNHGLLVLRGPPFETPGCAGLLRVRTQ
ncbi:hypothetical protein DU475_11695 [Rhodopseudomonas sp. WA056]|nr:hypothetical protein [Rhodopseudomonas sp. WA056]